MRLYKKLICIASALIFVSGCVGTRQSTPEGFIGISGTNLINPDGTAYFIKGTNLGNWLNPEGYMFGFGRTSSPRLINEMFCELVGPDRTAQFWKEFKDNYISREDIKFIASTGANTIRLPFNYRLFTDEDYMGLTKDQDGFARMDSLVVWAREAGLHVILDMHDCPGGQTGDNIDDSYGYPWLFESSESQALFCDIWQKIAEHFVNEPVILGYELANEPIAPYFKNVDDLNGKFMDVCKKAVQRIREVDNNHIILIGATQWNTNFKSVTDVSFDDKIILTCHRYGGEPTAESIRDYISFRDSTGLPMYMGEIGHNTFEWQRTFCEIMKENNIGYTFWPYKKRDNSCMVNFHVPDGWDDIICAFSESPRGDFGQVREARPDQEEAWRIMQEFTKNVRFENCRPDNEYIESMLLN